MNKFLNPENDPFPCDVPAGLMDRYLEEQREIIKFTENLIDKYQKKETADKYICMICLNKVVNYFGILAAKTAFDVIKQRCDLRRTPYNELFASKS